MKKILTIAIAIFLGFSSFSYAENSKENNTVVKPTQTGLDANQLMNEAVANHKEINWVSTKDVEESLKGVAPMNVSFDFDDTLFFSSPVFHKGQQDFSPKGNEYLQNQKFWDQANGGGDYYSIPKQIAIALVKMHHARGDKLYVITGRTAPSGDVDEDEDEDSGKHGKKSKKSKHSKKSKKSKDSKKSKKSKKSKHGKKSKDEKNADATMQVLNQIFGEGVFTEVVYAGKGEISKVTGSKKTAFLKKLNISLHYGDADEDIIAPHELGIRAIRFIRASNSTYYPLPKAGQYGEEVLKGSER